MAAEAGLIDPEPKTSDIKGDEAALEQNIMVVNADDSVEASADTNASSPTESATVGLFGGNLNFRSLGLKGGGRLKLGLFGGSPITPPLQPVSYRGGLFGGNKELTDIIQPQPGDNNSEDSETLSSNTKEDDANETEDEAREEAALLTSIKEEVKDSLDSRNMELPLLVKKQENGDGLSALASAALHHSKDFNKTENVTKEVTKDEKDVWYTVGIIKGTSFDVQSYFNYDGDTSNVTIDNLPDFSHLSRINLEPGTAYKFRVAAVNCVGRGEWSEVCFFTFSLFFLT